MFPTSTFVVLVIIHIADLGEDVHVDDAFWFGRCLRVGQVSENLAGKSKGKEMIDRMARKTDQAYGGELII